MKKQFYFCGLVVSSFRRLVVCRFAMPFLLAAIVLLAACGRSASERRVSDASAEGFYGSSATVRVQGTTADEASADGGTAQVVRMYEIPAPLTDRPEQILHRKGFTISYNRTTKTPNWVAWHLTKNHTYGQSSRDTQEFREDSSVGSPRATLDDYYNSRYDRGHMCPAGDSKWSDESMAQTFLLTNICPQNHGLNKYSWNDLEIECRSWARKYGAVDIVCGPVYRSAVRADGKMKASPQQKFIGRNKVWVPDAFFKVVLCRGRNPKAIGFIYENRSGQQSMKEAATTVDEIERITGIDFFPLVADDVEDRVEAQAKLSVW